MSRTSTSDPARRCLPPRPEMARARSACRVAQLFVVCCCLQPGFCEAAPAPVTSAQIKEVAKELVCLCGSCNRESLATCICTAFAVPEREVIGEALAGGQTHQQIVDSFVERFGPRALAAPPASGYTLLAWIGPFVGLAFGVFVVRQALLRWRRGHAATETVSGTSSRTVDPEIEANPMRQQLERELDEFDRE